MEFCDHLGISAVFDIVKQKLIFHDEWVFNFDLEFAIVIASYNQADCYNSSQLLYLPAKIFNKFVAVVWWLVRCGGVVVSSLRWCGG